jgi:4-hydroxy-tetrahydrodipicolinate synthase
MHSAWAAGDHVTAADINDKLFPLNQALFLEPSPQGVKYAASLNGKSTADVRLPLVELTGPTKKAIEDGMRFAGLI